MESRIRSAVFRSRVMPAAEAAKIIESGMTVAIGGYTSCGYPKVIINELAARKKSGEELLLNVVTGANNGFVDGILAEAEIIIRRAPMIENKVLAAQVNKGKVAYCEQQMNKMPQLLRSESFGHINVAVVEALAVNEDGSFVPTNAVGMLPNLVDAADRVIIEINTAMPLEMEGMHDIFIPNGTPIPLVRCGDRIGSNAVACAPEKIVAIVESDILDEVAAIAPAGAGQIQIARNLFSFLREEMRRQGRTTLPPIQTGFGNLAAEIVKQLAESEFEQIEFFAGVAQEANVLLAASGKVDAISCGSVKLSPAVLECLKNDAKLRRKLILRNGELTNSSEVIARLGPVALSSGIEMDIYGNVNSSHISGSKVVNGLGGGANFAENAGLSIMMIVSENKGGAISTIVPMVSHQDIGEHDIDVVVTEHGVADLRGKSDVERARAIIGNCAGLYKEQLTDYLDRAVAETGGHHPILLAEALSWHERLKKTGSMQA